MVFCASCLRPSNSSIVTHTQQPTLSLKSLLRRQLLKKSTNISRSRAPTQCSNTQNNVRFQRLNGSNFVREVNPMIECSFKANSTNNYDMTIFHNDQMNETDISISHRRKKNIPRWARKSQIQLAFINQIYFNDKNPEEIFGSIQLDLAREMMQSIDTTDLYSSTLFPPNFV
ncbi:unnamed protein product [Adineta ricciae]|uniref:Inner centromere protein ARK-binding domain-containing protein n=1 Tax=Adineta ricciae TaxID=249248 RepID=A0A816EYK2_ADIRI|nr:unnamed protein product [Adineta ricciae]CAF1655451.1 unnamed protein product [Adineta ricciae]